MRAVASRVLQRLSLVDNSPLIFHQLSWLLSHKSSVGETSDPPPGLIPCLQRAFECRPAHPYHNIQIVHVMYHVVALQMVPLP